MDGHAHNTKISKYTHLNNTHTHKLALVNFHSEHSTHLVILILDRAIRIIKKSYQIKVIFNSPYIHCF